MTTILLDGLWGNPARLGLMRRNLSTAGVANTETFAYDSSGFGCLQAAGQRLGQRIRELGEPVNLIGYSMGGLVIRAALAASADLPVEKIAFLNTPHQGSLLAHTLPGKGMSQMRPGSDFLNAIETVPRPGKVLAVWTPGDLMVIPGRSACWDQATETLCCRVPAHVWPLFSPTLHRRIAEFLNQP